MRALVLVFLVGCRFSWATHLGVPARPSNVTTLALFAKDGAAKNLAREVLVRDPHIQLLDADAPDSEQCRWAAAHGAEMYAVAYVDAGYDSTFKCTKTEGGILTKHEECVDGYETNQHTSASYSLTTYDAATCKEIPRLTARFSTTALGEEEQSKPEALATLAERVRAKSEALPDQVTIDAQGRVDAADGFYAVFRGDQYRGYVRRDGETLTPMYCCFDPKPGDTLVERGRRKFLELGVDLVGGAVHGEFGLGVGVHLRHYALDGGLQFGIGADALDAQGASMRMVDAHIGYGMPVSPGVVLAALIATGPAIQTRDVNTEKVWSGWSLTPMVRVQTFLTTSVFGAVEAGYSIIGHDISERSLISRMTLGIDL